MGIWNVLYSPYANSKSSMRSLHKSSGLTFLGSVTKQVSSWLGWNMMEVTHVVMGG